MNAYAVPGVYRQPTHPVFDIVTRKCVEKINERYSENVTLEDVKGRCRLSEISLARHFAFYFLRRYTDFSLHRIGMVFNRNHASVFYAIEKINDLCDVDKAYREMRDEIDEQLKELI